MVGVGVIPPFQDLNFKNPPLQVFLLAKLSEGVELLCRQRRSLIRDEVN